MRAMLLLVMISAGCAKTPQIDPDLRVRMNQFVEKERVRTPQVIRANIVRKVDMGEADAVKMWLETGVYRGLTDQEWVNLMILIQGQQ